MKVTVLVEKGKDMYGCTTEEDLSKYGFGLSGNGTSARKGIEDLLLASSEMKAYYEETGRSYPELEFAYKFDIGSFFNYYSYLNISEVAKRIGITPSLMRKYAAGVSTPSEKRLREIETGLNALATEISGTQLWACR